MTDTVFQWLLDSDEPWTRYRTLTDLLGRPASDPEVCSQREKMIQHPRVKKLLASASIWGADPFKRHNDAGYAIYKISTLADFGLCEDDPGMDVMLEKVFAHQAPEGAFQTVVNIPKTFGGDGNDHWTWILCDSPTLLYSLLAFGLGEDGRVQKALEHLVAMVDENGWRCACAPELGKFRGPGRKEDPCPIVNVYALKALALAPEYGDSAAVHNGAEMLLSHWAGETGPKMYLFGAGSDYRKLKYPFVWYNILHVADVLSRFPFVHANPLFQKMLEAITAQADAGGHYTAGSMYMSWKGWSFADKKNPSPWLTLLVLRIIKRINPTTAG